MPMQQTTNKPILTLAYLRQQFDYYNKLCFEGTLPTPVLRINNARTMLGCVRYKKEHRLFRKPRFCDFTLSISAYYKLTPEETDDIILHEMIHLDILCHQQHDDSAHGPLFRQRMKEINERFGRHITISHKGKLQLNSEKKVQNIIAVAQLNDGTWTISRVSPSRFHELQRLLPRSFKLQSIAWYNTRNPFFCNYPRSLTPKLYRISKADLDKELQGAIEIKQ